MPGWWVAAGNVSSLGPIANVSRSPDQRGRVSNPNWPGPSRRDEQDGSPGWRSRPSRAPREQSPWDAGDAGFWRSNGQQRSADRGSGPRHSGRAGSAANRVGSRFASTADGLKNRLGLRGSVVSRDRRAQADDDFWADRARQRSGRGPATNGYGRRGRNAGASLNGDRTEAWQEGEPGGNGYRGSRRGSGRATGAFGAVTARIGSTALRDRAGINEPGWRGGGGGNGWDGGRGGRFDRHGRRLKRSFATGSWWRHWTVKKVFGVLGVGFALFILLCIGLFFILYSMTSVQSAADKISGWQSSTVYFANGKPLGSFNNNGQTRVLLTVNQIPKVMTQAMTAAEDRNFYTEGGVSITGLVRSGFQDLFGSGGQQGGSTITMQYAKNTNGFAPSLSTKLKEIFIAIKLAHSKSKQWIMTNYLNMIPFCNTELGLGAAAEAYFNVNLNKPGTTLTIAQAAMLAAMPNEPGVFSPIKGSSGYAPLVQRWQYVLGNMVRDGNITQQQAAAQKFPKITPGQTTNGWTGYKGYLMQMVQQQLQAPKKFGGYGLTQNQLDTGGYKITTTFNMAMVNALARSVNQEKAAMAAAGQAPPKYDRIGAVLEDPKSGAIIAVYGGPGYLTDAKRCQKVQCQFNNAEAPEQVGSSFKPYVLSTAVKEGMSVFTSKL